MLLPNHIERHLLGLVVIPLAWNQSDTRVKSFCRRVQSMKKKLSIISIGIDVRVGEEDIK